MDIRDMTIHVKDLASDRILTLEMKPGDTISNVKDRIQDKWNIPKRFQGLLYSGLAFEDDRTISFYNINPGSTLSLVPRLLGGGCCDGIKIDVKTATGNTISLDVSADDTISNVKSKIPAKERFPPGQKLFFNGDQLADDRTVLDYDIVVGSVLHLQPKNKLATMTIYVTPSTDDTKRITLSVKPSDTVKDLKAKLQEKNGVPRDQQQLVFAGRVLEDDQPLSYYDIQDGSTIVVFALLIGGASN